MKINIFSLNTTTIIPLTLIALISGTLINSVLVDQFAEVQPKPNRREMLSLPFQHTARFIKYHEKEVSEADKEIINAVLNYEIIRVEYNPYRSDPVKRTHDEEATTAELMTYFKLVLKQAYAHPLLAVESVAVSHSNLFNVNISMNDYYITSLLMGEDNPQILTLYDKLELKESPLVLKINKARVFLYRLWDRIPILSQLNNYASYIFLLFAMFAIYLRDKKYTYAAILVPVLAFLATLIAGPISIGYIRYILPIILSVIIMFGFFIDTHTKKIYN